MPIEGSPKHRLADGVSLGRGPMWLFIVCSILGCVCLMNSLPGVAQNGTATITGTISDTTGGAVPDAQIAAKNVQTGVIYHVHTSATGDYTLPLLPVGIYDVSAEKQGFSIAQKTRIHLNIADVSRVDLTLSVGSTSTTVSVSASTVELNTENAEESSTVSDKLVSELPLNGRNFLQLQLLDGTAYETDNTVVAEFRPSQLLADGGTVGIGGSRQTSAGFLIDGLNNRDIGYGAPILIPSIDALEQFKEQSKTYSAEYGGEANQIQLHFKSGTNSLHGTAYEFVRNNDFDSRGFLEPSVPALNQNQFGYSFGGPIFIPRLYDGRNKTFFFANYEGLRVKSQSAPIYQTVPTSAQWSGQISENPIVDPVTGQPFAGNQVPSGRISQFAKAFQQYVVTPNTNSPLGNWVGSVNTPTTADQQNYKFDEHLTSKDSLFFRYSTSTNESTSNGPNGTGIYNQTIEDTSNQAYQISYTRMFSPNLVNQATYGHVQANFNSLGPTISESALTPFGINGGFSPQPTPEIPLVIFEGNSGGLPEFGVNPNLPQLDETEYWNGFDDMTWTHGRHTIDAGFSDLNWNHTYGKGANLGQWTFNGQYSGDPFADFLLGNPYQISISVPSPLALTAADAVFQYPQYTFAIWGQDSWKQSRRLTINAGLRYEFYLQAHEAQGRYMWFNPNVPGGAECTANQTAAQDVGQSGLLSYCGPNPTASPRLSFAPRLGIAFLPTNNEKTVLRAGYGIFFDAGDEGDTVNASDNYPFLGAQSFNGTPGTDILSTSMQIPAITSLVPVSTSDLGLIFLATNKKENPYIGQWTLSVEHQPFPNTAIEVAYEGSLGIHASSRLNLNQPLQYDPSNPLSVAARRPYPSFGDVYAQTFTFPSNYNAGTLRVRHTGASLVLMAAYTLSKSMDERSGEFGASPGDVNGWAGPMDAANPRLDYGRADFDIRQRVIVSAVHELPVGRGKRFLANVNTPVNEVIGGWELTGIATFQTGLPFSIGAADTNGVIDTNGQRADLVGNPFPSGFQKSANEWFNTAAFTQPDPGIYGTSGRNILSAPGVVNFDTSLDKSFNVTEHARFQFRAEAFNVFNHTNLGIPNNFIPPAGTGFGAISSAAPARVLQFGGKMIF